MGPLTFLIRKELLLLSRDLHGLLLLFIMPCVFILVMTFALQNQYSLNAGTELEFYLFDADGSDLSQRFGDELGALESFQRLPEGLSFEEMQQRTQADDAKFLLVVAEDFQRHLLQQEEPAVELHFAPGTSPIFVGVVEAQVTFLLKRLSLERAFRGAVDDPEVLDQFLDGEGLVSSYSLYQGDKQYPSSVQQNVPAWLLFAMFFIAIPLSTTLIGERQQGTLMRLKTLGVSGWQMMAGKLVPFFGVNLIQALLLFLVGLYLVPLLGGDQLTLGDNPAALLVVVLAASLAAVSYALLIAQLASTVEQATIFAAVGNIIMAAVGGVMVPRFIMPSSMQALSDYSPMAWGLEGFFDILLRGGSVQETLPEVTQLLLFAAVMLVLAVLFSRRHHRA